MYLLYKNDSGTITVTPYENVITGLTVLKNTLEELITVERPCLCVEAEHALQQMGMSVYEYNIYNDNDKAIVQEAIDNSVKQAFREWEYRYEFDGDFLFIKLFELVDGEPIEL